MPSSEAPWTGGACLRRVCVRLARAGLPAVVALSLSGAPAAAATGHQFLSSSSEASPGTTLRAPDAVAVDRSSGDVFVGDPGGGVVDVYGSSGQFVAQFGGGLLVASGIAVDEASGEVYVADTPADAVLVFRPDGSGGYELLSRWFGEGLAGGEFGEVTGVAVDNSNSSSAGLVYVVDGEDAVLKEGVVDVFEPKPAGPEEDREGSLVRVLSAGKMEAPDAIAVSASTGRVLVGDSLKGAIYAYNAEGAYEEKLNGKGSPDGSFKGKEAAGNLVGIAVDEGSGDVYVAEAERHAVSQYSPTGEWQGWIAATPAGVLDEPRGVAVTSAGDVYVADAGAGVVDQFGPGAPVPDVETGKVAKSGLTRTTALLSGSVDGEGNPSKYHFQYGESTALGSDTATAGSGPGEEAVSATAEGLHAGRTYYFRIVGEDEDGTNYGPIREFETSPAVAALETGLAENVAPEGATLTGSLERGGLATRYYFQYGTSEAYGQMSPAPPGEAPPAEQEKEEKQARTLETDISGLSPNTLYHYRLVAENSYGTTYGADRTFTTSGPPRITYEPTSAIGQQEATIHAEVDPDQLATTYHFEYGETSSYGTEVPLGGQSIASGSVPVAVSASLASLKVGTTYHFRVLATNSAGTTVADDQTFNTVPSALIESASAGLVGSSEATLQAQIDPLGHDTTYYFQYGTESCKTDPGGCASVPAPPGIDIGAGTAGIQVSQTIQGLSPATTYHYRTVAINGLGITAGPEHTLTTQSREASFALADGRAWELVTPPDKFGSPVEPPTQEGGLILAAEDGDAITYVADGSIVEEPQGNRSPEMQQMLSTRTSEGWRTQDIATPNGTPQGVRPGSPQEYQFATPDLSQALVEPVGSEPPLAAEATQRTIYVRSNASGSYLPLVTSGDVPAGTQFEDKIRFLGATPDLSHVVLHSEVPLGPFPATSGIYEWSEGQLQFVSILPTGARAREPELGYYHVTAHAISDDGTRVIWTTPEENLHRGHLYMRDTASGETIQLDAAQGAPEPRQGYAQFQTASSDGSRVFFTDEQRLTADATAEPEQVGGKADLYECEIIEEAGKLACRLQDLTVDHTAGEHAAVQGFVLGSSEDGTSIYFVAHGVLAGNENGNGESAQPGKDNLYLVHFDGTGWTTRFIAVLTGEDSPEWEGGEHANTAFLTARASPSGSYLAFMSAGSLTGYDNRDQNSGARDEEVYLYDANTASLTCASCDPTGARPEGVLDAERVGEGLGLVVDRRKVWVGHWLAGSIPGWTAQSLVSAVFQPRYLSDSGRLFFNSPADLLPQAVNHKEDVYEYEPSGVGSCESPSGGCVSLISSGGSEHESAFLEATPSGNDVYFLTAAPLLPQDTDTAFDIYDARVCSGESPCLTPPAPAPAGCSSADACRAAQPAQPAPLGPSGTASASGSGDVSQPKSAVLSLKTSKPTPKVLTRAQKLAGALKTCRKQHPHSRVKRTRCEARANKKYGATIKKHAGRHRAKTGRR